ncbi:hypothetical protein ACFQE1_03685 [Halobium palmae]|uniref:Uncharacterized protein n=1 Tax=Halobium palmae TaxID=1776492 RepID=A0ABD5RVQ0_9EURY
MVNIEDLEHGTMLATSIAVFDYEFIKRKRSGDEVIVCGPRGRFSVDRDELQDNLDRGRVWIRGTREDQDEELEDE